MLRKNTLPLTIKFYSSAHMSYEAIHTTIYTPSSYMWIYSSAHMSYEAIHTIYIHLLSACESIHLHTCPMKPSTQLYIHLLSACKSIHLHTCPIFRSYSLFWFTLVGSCYQLVSCVILWYFYVCVFRFMGSHLECYDLHLLSTVFRNPTRKTSNNTTGM